jgi:hypothetical protein
MWHIADSVKKFPVGKKSSHQKEPGPFDGGGLDEQAGDEHQEISNEQNFGHGRAILRFVAGLQ